MRGRPVRVHRAALRGLCGGGEAGGEGGWQVRGLHVLVPDRADGRGERAAHRMDQGLHVQGRGRRGRGSAAKGRAGKARARRAARVGAGERHGGRAGARAVQQRKRQAGGVRRHPGDGHQRMLRGAGGRHHQGVGAQSHGRHGDQHRVGQLLRRGAPHAARRRLAGHGFDQLRRAALREDDRRHVPGRAGAVHSAGVCAHGHRIRGHGDGAAQGGRHPQQVGG
mmetsp:Transcript_22943/g.70895  ORF Transcript_22943/g.70895 Transcript_22943/m.70895 type:complete len:223 (+) Transcript_22943:337-1005(+)